MFQSVFRWTSAIALFAHTLVLAQSPTPATGHKTSVDELVDSLGANDLQAALSQVKTTFVNSDAVNETELNRAALAGLLLRLPDAIMILPGPATPAPDVPLYGEILEQHFGYLRLGSLTTGNLKGLDRKLSEFAGKKVDAVVIDLRASSQQTDFATAAEFAKRFCPKGKTLFTLHRPAARQDRSFECDREPAFQLLIVILIDSETAGAAEAVAGALRLNTHALAVGQSSAGRAVEYSDFPLPGGKTLRIAQSEAVLPNNTALFPNGITPDVPVEMALVEKRQIFQASNEKGMGPFIYESERPHLNEAALLAGTNPELDAAESQHRAGGKSKAALHDSVLQRALDALTSIEIYQKH